MVCRECLRYINQDNYAEDGMCIGCVLYLEEEDLLDQYTDDIEEILDEE